MLISLPKEILELDDPKYIIAPSIYVQSLVLAFLVGVPFLTLIWIALTYISSKNIEFGEIVLFIIMFILLIIASHRRFRTRWVAFACNKNGIYLLTKIYDYLYVPWTNVGSINIGWVQSADVKLSEGLIFELILTDEEWKTLANSIPDDNNGFRKMGVANNGLNVRMMLDSVNKIRMGAS